MAMSGVGTAYKPKVKGKGCWGVICVRQARPPLKCAGVLSADLPGAVALSLDKGYGG